MDPTPGASLVSGIQDMSAFLPLIGTQQCERHVGEALDGGFLYAAATPLSLFGSLGIVKAGAAILCASISPRAAKMLADAGFNLQGSIAVMIGEAPRATSRGSEFKFMDTKDGSEDHGQTGTQYLASHRFLQLLEEQHIDQARVKLVFNYYRWNFWLCISTLGLAGLSLAPYINIIMLHDHTHQSSPPTWTYPLMRIVGSALSVIAAQLILQIGIQRILRMTLKTANEQPE
jgi:hypothetical protein